MVILTTELFLLKMNIIIWDLRCCMVRDQCNFFPNKPMFREKKTCGLYARVRVLWYRNRCIQWCQSMGVLEHRCVTSVVVMLGGAGRPCPELQTSSSTLGEKHCE